MAAADVLVAHGVRVVEFALTTDGALDALERYCSAAPAKACVGAGTVLTAADARSAVSRRKSLPRHPGICSRRR